MANTNMDNIVLLLTLSLCDGRDDPKRNYYEILESFLLWTMALTSYQNDYEISYWVAMIIREHL